MPWSGKQGLITLVYLHGHKTVAQDVPVQCFSTLLCVTCMRSENGMGLSQGPQQSAPSKHRETTQEFIFIHITYYSPFGVFTKCVFSVGAFSLGARLCSSARGRGTRKHAQVHITRKLHVLNSGFLLPDLWPKFCRCVDLPRNKS